MNLIGLIDTTGLLLNIARRNPAPTDKVAANFLKSKKSLGSNDRRFILNLLFFYLRNMTLFDYIAENFPNTDKLLESISKNEKLNSKPKDFSAILIAFYAATQIDYFAGEVQLEQFINKKQINDSGSIVSTFQQTMQGYCEWTQLDINNWTNNLLYLFELIYNSSLNEINENSKFNITNYQYSIILYSFPDWIINNLLQFTSLSIANIFNLAAAFTKSAPITIRINSLSKKAEQVAASLKENGVELTKCSLSPAAYNLSHRIYLSEHPLAKTGAIEIQDEASQLVAYAMAPSENWVILDACAGAGGKSLHLATLQNDSGRIIATDKELMRLKELPKRAQNAGLQSIRTYLIDSKNKPIVKDENVKYFKRRAFNAILIDAPCSGMGTLRREPMKKYRTTSRLIEKMSNLQYQILSEYSQYLNIGGVLIYATCSIMPQENDAVVEKFLENQHEFAPDSLSNAFDKYGIAIAELEDNYKFTFYPHLFGTDGFFISRMIKIE